MHGYARSVAGQRKPGRLVRFLWRRGFLLLGVAAFTLVRMQSGSWWWALVAGVTVNPGLLLATGAVAGTRARKQADTEPKAFIAVPEIADDERSRRWAAEVRKAREALIGIGSARIELVRDIEVEQQDLGRGLLARSMNRFIDLVRHHVGEGVIDLSHHRMMLDFGHYATAQIGADDYAGPSGGPLRSTADLPDPRPFKNPTPLWFVAVIGHTTRAAESGADDVDGIRCRRLEVLLNLTDPAPPESPLQWTPAWPDPTAVPMVVWLEGSVLRRLRYEETPGASYTLTLRDIGLDLSELDWERLSTFRTPAESLRTEPNVV